MSSFPLSPKIPIVGHFLTGNEIPLMVFVTLETSFITMNLLSLPPLPFPLTPYPHLHPLDQYPSDLIEQVEKMCHVDDFGAFRRLN